MSRATAGGAVQLSIVPREHVGRPVRGDGRGRVLEWRDLDNQMASDAPPTREPKPLGGALSRVTASSVAAGDGHVLVVGSRGEVVSFGNNERGQCGTGSEEAACAEPTLLTTLPTGAKATQVACGCAHSLVLLSDGGVLAFGDDRNIQLGVRARTVKAMRDGASSVRVPQRVQQLPADRPVVAVAAGGGGSRWTAPSSSEERTATRSGRAATGVGVSLACARTRISQTSAAVRAAKLREWDEEKKRVIGVRVSQLVATDIPRRCSRRQRLRGLERPRPAGQRQRAGHAHASAGERPAGAALRRPSRYQLRAQQRRRMDVIEDRDPSPRHLGPCTLRLWSPDARPPEARCNAAETRR